MKPDEQHAGETEIGQNSPSAAILRQIAAAMNGLRFGSVEVVIQDSRVVQIERKEKFRFDKKSAGPGKDSGAS